MADTYTVTRSTTVAAAPERVQEQIVDFHRWRAWSPWEDLDPELRREYSGPDSGVGATYHWSGNRKAGRGTMTITDVTVPSEVRIDLAFEKPFKAQNQTWFTIVPDGDGSRVTWSLTGRNTVLTRVMGLVKSMDSLVGPDFEKGLARLKTSTES